MFGNQIPVSSQCTAANAGGGFVGEGEGDAVATQSSWGRHSRCVLGAIHDENKDDCIDDLECSWYFSFLISMHVMLILLQNIHPFLERFVTSGREGPQLFQNKMKIYLSTPPRKALRGRSECQTSALFSAKPIPSDILIQQAFSKCGVRCWLNSFASHILF